MPNTAVSEDRKVTAPKTGEGKKLNTAKPVRESGIELLRIFLMLQVIFLHVVTYGEYGEMAMERLGPLDSLLYWAVWFCSRCPVYVYIVLFGYFNVTSKTGQTIKDTKGKAIKMYLPMLFYSLTITAAAMVTGKVEITPVKVIDGFFPLLSRTWYFMTLYLIVLIFSPFINRLLNNISKKEFMYLLLLCFLIFSVWDMLANIKPINQIVSLDKVAKTQGGKSIYGFVFMYLIGGYLRLHVPKYDKAKFRFLFAFFALGAVNVLLVYLFPAYRGAAAAANSNPIAVIQGVCLVLFFRDMKFKSRIINWIAAANLGVYMIHEHPYVRAQLWKHVPTKNIAFYDNWYYPLIILLICVGVFIACGAVEKIRVLLFDLIGKGYKKIFKKA